MHSTGYSRNIQILFVDQWHLQYMTNNSGLKLVSNYYILPNRTQLQLIKIYFLQKWYPVQTRILNTICWLIPMWIITNMDFSKNVPVWNFPLMILGCTNYCGRCKVDGLLFPSQVDLQDYTKVNNVKVIRFIFLHDLPGLKRICGNRKDGRILSLSPILDA